MRKYIIMGVQGSGKGTHAKLLAEALDLEHISVGDIFRWNIQHTPSWAPRSGAAWPPANWSLTTWSRPWSTGA
jgi:adenylate kinase family enzyme